MKGTEKQIAWAEQIKAEAIGNIESRIDQYQQKFAEYGSKNFSAQVSASKIMREILTTIFSLHDDAAWIIDHRALLQVTGWSAKVDRFSELIASGRMTVEEVAAKNGLKNYKE